MDNKYILISLNYFEISIVTLVLLYTFLNTEKDMITSTLAPIRTGSPVRDENALSKHITGAA